MDRNADDAPYLDPSLPVDRRVEDLLGRMTLREKVGQLVGTWAGQLETYHDVEAVKGQVVEDGVGAVASFGWAGAVDSRLDDVVETVNRLQRTATRETRLGVPLLFNVDAVHGHAYVAEATAFPNGLGMAATRDRDLAERAAAVTAREVRATGAHRTYAPTCDVARDPRWGRVFETFGESPYLCGELAAAQVHGFRGDGLVGPEGGDDGDDDPDGPDEPASVLTTAKHFPAYSEPVRGEDAAPVETSAYTLRNVFLPPFLDALDAGVDSVMPCYNAVDGEPAHGSRRYLADLLRGRLGFDGTVVSDWGGVAMLHEDHRTAADARDAVRATREAGLDVASVGAVDHADNLRALVEADELAGSVVDDAVRRVLREKVRLGLFEDPFVDPDAARATVGSDAHRALSLEAARESMTLLKNEGLLPLDRDADVLVAGPNADDVVHQLGGWSVTDPAGVDGVTILGGIESACEGTVTYEQGATVTEERDVEAAARAAADADVAVVAVGENWYLHEFGPSDLSGTATGEFPTRSRLRLPPAQKRLLRAIHDTGTPAVGALVTGRPLIVDWMAERLPAILLAYYPGTLGGRAVAETLFGAVDPGGRLPVSVPRSTGHLPTRFNHLPHPTPIGRDEHPPSYDPLYPFGHGLSYADFEYGDLELGDATVGPYGETVATVPVTNVSTRRGTEVVHLYVRDEAGSRVTPVRELRGFERVALDPGETRRVSIAVEATSLGRVEPDGTRRPEPGEFVVSVGEQEATLTVESAYG